MSEEGGRPTFGFLICGMVIGLSLGTIATKQDHNVLWMIVGPILGTVAGGFLESFACDRK
jgi:hypothetical protein